MVNVVPNAPTRTVRQIVRANVVTPVNLIILILAVLVIVAGSPKNALFGFVIIANSAIGIIQELRAKQTLDKLAIVGQAKPLVRRQSGTKALLPLSLIHI